MNRNIVIGAAFFGIGALVTIVTYALAAGGGVYVVATGAIAVGAIQFLYGVLQAVWGSLKSPAQKEKDRYVSGSRLILHSMVFVAAADGELVDDELLLINLISRMVIGVDFDRASIEKMFGDLVRDGGRFLDAYDFGSNPVDPTDARLAVKAAAMIAMADGHVAKSEIDRVGQVAAKFGLAPQLAEIIRESREDYSRLLDAIAAPASQDMTEQPSSHKSDVGRAKLPPA